jgi:hypothetical protein
VATTTIRVDTATHAKLIDLTKATGASLMETVRDAAEALRRQRFAQQVQREISDLRGDESGWADYMADAETTSVADGLHR